MDVLVSSGFIRPHAGRRVAVRLSFQIVVVCLAAILLPLAMPLIFSGELPTTLAGTRITQVTSLIAALAALLMFRRFTAYPGTRGFAYVIPIFSATFALGTAALLGFRLSYSGSMLLAGYASTMMATFVLWYVGDRIAPLRLYYVPAGNMAIVEDTPQVEWIPLLAPQLPGDPHGAIVADLHWDHSPEWERLLADAAIAGRPVYHIKQLHESLTGFVQLHHLSENSFGSLLPNRAYHSVKRAIDVIACVLLLPILALPMLIISLLIRRDSPGPSLFRQQRMGFRGRPFEVLKFRTMVDRPAPDGAGIRESITLDDDQRITRLGRFLRKSRVDELPQIINVLRGEMSWIGPRPEAMALSGWYENEIPFYRYRHIVRPGITGWAQVNQGHVAELDDVHIKLHYDFYYIKNFSAWLDVLIAMRTCATILTGFGAR